MLFRAVHRVDNQLDWGPSTDHPKIASILIVTTRVHTRDELLRVKFHMSSTVWQLSIISSPEHEEAGEIEKEVPFR